MSTYREIIYLVKDELKLLSDDSNFTEEFIMYLIDRYRATVIKQKLSDIRKSISSDVYQSITVQLEHNEGNYNPGHITGGVVKSVFKIPSVIDLRRLRAFPSDDSTSYINYVSKERLQYVGNNRHTSKMIYCAIGEDNHLYLKSQSPSLLSMDSLKLESLYQSPIEAYKFDLTNKGDTITIEDIDCDCHIESSLIMNIVDMIVKELSKGIYLPEDDENNAKDDLSNISTKNNQSNAR